MTACSKTTGSSTRLHQNRTTGNGRDRCHSGGFLLRIMPPSWHPVPACAPRLCCRRNHSLLPRRPLQAEPFLSAATKIRFGRGRSLSRLLLQASHSSLQRRRLESDAEDRRLDCRGRRAILLCSDEDKNQTRNSLLRRPLQAKPFSPAAIPKLTH